MKHNLVRFVESRLRDLKKKGAKQMIYADFNNHVELQIEQNLAHFGKQDITTLLIAAGEEFGEVCHEFLKNPQTNKFRIEIIHLAALLPVMYTASISERRSTK